MPRTRVSFEMRQKAKSLRVHATRAESLLWHELRALKGEGIGFRRQRPAGPYIVDCASFSSNLIVEVDGDTHETDRGRRHDANRDDYLRSLCFEVLRVDEPDVIRSAWHGAPAVKTHAAARCRYNPTRPLRGHPPLEGEGCVAPQPAHRQ